MLETLVKENSINPISIDDLQTRSLLDNCGSPCQKERRSDPICKLFKLSFAIDTSL